ncbi:Tryptophan synthase beta chain 1 [Thermoplasmatales archaeon]|nr:Tryptophan synthase beta chain 1 [Thermoplasmatales archaeon]
MVDGYLTVSDEEAIPYTREMARKEGIFAGYSSGANVGAALKLASLIGKGKNVVILLPGSGLKYLSTDLFPSKF